MVPSQKASMSANSRPGTEAMASVVASVRRSSTPLSHSSPKRVQPMPITATWSRMPLLPIGLRSLTLVAGPVDGRTGLPEVIVHALSRPHAPEGHRDAVPYGELRRDDIRHFAAVAAATVEVDDHAHHRWGQAEGEVVDSEGGHGPGHVGKALGLHLVDGGHREAGPG